MLIAVVIIAAVCLAYANGANDNFKGVATLLGSRTTDYRGALRWATICTLLGSLAALLLATTLLKRFTGRGLVPEDLAASSEYGAAVALGAGLTVLLATRIGMPISTTHALVGALVGAGWAAHAAVDVSQLGSGFFLPLLVSPLIALGATLLIYPLARLVGHRLGLQQDSCVCVADGAAEGVPAGSETAVCTSAVLPRMTLGNAQSCGPEALAAGISARGLLDQLHFLSAGVVSFARGLNDTPKIAAMLLLVPAIGGSAAITIVAVAIAVGGLLSARRVAETMSEKITAMNHAQGFTANIVTGMIVIAASRFGLPVSTTHVSCGALFGMGTVTGQAHWRTIGTVLLAWVTTLPVGAAAGAAAYALLTRMA
jgi:inorganic phosphate transporter, PiT family